MQEQILDKKVEVKSDITTLDFKLHTIIMLVGPLGCGKTHFAENKIIPEIESYGDVSISRVSSDDIRRELLGDSTISKKDSRMIHVSKPAFEFLDAKVRALTSYPINTDFVIIDSTGLNKDFRDSIKKIADEKGYNLAVVMFDYKGRQPYYEYLTDDDEDIKTTSRQLEHMRKVVMSEVSKKTYKEIYKIKSHDLSKYKVNVINYDRYQGCILPEELDYVVIGDIHGCYDEFIALLEKNGFVIDKENKKILGHEDDE